MTRRALRPCTFGGAPPCAELVPGGLCKMHKRARQQEYNARRGSSTAQGYDGEHRALRAQAIAERGEVCEDCGEGPRPNDPIEADHIVALKDGGARALENIRLRHKSCHARKTALVDHRWGR